MQVPTVLSFKAQHMKRILITILIVGAALLIYYGRDASMFRQSKIRQNAKEPLATIFQDGDIIFQTSKSSQSKAVQLATHSKYSHMGIIYNMGGEYYVYEAVQPVKLTKLNNWIKRGENSHYVAKRLKNSKEIFTKENVKKMKSVGERFKGKSYDIYFEWSDDKIYCSELVWKIYKEALNIEIGELQELRESDLTNIVVKNKMKERYGEKIPLTEKVISPVTIFKSERVVTVVEE